MAGQIHDQRVVPPGQGANKARPEGVIQKPLEGWRLGGTLFSLAFGLLLAVIETSITATALVSIGEYFEDSVTVTWVVLSYLLSYMGFAIIFTRLSDGIGRQPAVITAYVLFAAFSLGCGLAQTLNQVIAFRVLQGIGGSGLFSMIMVIGPEITPVRYWGGISGMIGLVLATGSVLGPILGGVISEKASWRWIYLFNAPCAGLGIAVMLICWPRKEKSYALPKLNLESLKMVDWLGALLLLAASVLIVFPLQEAGSTAYAWNSPTIISTLTVGGVCWIGFFAWIAWVSFGPANFQFRAIFPLHIAFAKPTGPAIILILLTGFPFYVTIINLPQRFQIVNGDSPIMAGVHLLPMLCALALGSFLGGIASSKNNYTSPTLIVAACLILLGSGLMSTLGGGQDFYKPTYGYQVILGLGMGLTFSAATLQTNLCVNQADVGAAQGAISQVRILGGSIGLAAATIILNMKLSDGLAAVLDPARVKALQQSLNTIAALPPEVQGIVSDMYTNAFNDQMRVCTYVSIPALWAAIWTYQRHPASVEAMIEKQKNAIKTSQEEEHELVDTENLRKASKDQELGLPMQGLPYRMEEFDERWPL